jgi:magnesium chelatase family protein
LDELPEFPRACLEGLREPLEDGRVGIVRAGHALEMPARFQLMAAMNPCPCGYLGHPTRACVDAPASVARYQQKVSGPFMDRMDLVVGVQPTSPEELSAAEGGESSASIRGRVIRARARQRRRFEGVDVRSNAEVPASPSALRAYLSLDEGAEDLLARVARQRELSPRAQHRLRRVARTLTDLDPLFDDGGDLNAAIPRETVARAVHLRRPPEHAA